MLCSKPWVVIFYFYFSPCVFCLTVLLQEPYPCDGAHSCWHWAAQLSPEYLDHLEISLSLPCTHCTPAHSRYWASDVAKHSQNITAPPPPPLHVCISTVLLCIPRCVLLAEAMWGSHHLSNVCFPWVLGWKSESPKPPWVVITEMDVHDVAVDILNTHVS